MSHVSRQLRIQKVRGQIQADRNRPPAMGRGRRRLVGRDGLERAPGVAYEGFPVGKPIGSMSYDRLDPRAPEFTRFSLQQIYFPGITNILAQAGHDPATSFFGVAKKELRARWRS